MPKWFVSLFVSVLSYFRSCCPTSDGSRLCGSAWPKPSLRRRAWPRENAAGGRRRGERHEREVGGAGSSFLLCSASPAGPGCLLHRQPAIGRRRGRGREERRERRGRGGERKGERGEEEGEKEQGAKGRRCDEGEERGREERRRETFSASSIVEILSSSAHSSHTP